MRRTIQYFITGMIFISACSSERPYYKTAEGKRKQRYYNAVQFGQENVPKPKF
jgi:hypothetical protein